MGNEAMVVVVVAAADRRMVADPTERKGLAELGLQLTFTTTRGT
jgi:hypothetical protein